MSATSGAAPAPSGAGTVGTDDDGDASGLGPVAAPDDTAAASDDADDAAVARDASAFLEAAVNVGVPGFAEAAVSVGVAAAVCVAS